MIVNINRDSICTGDDIGHADKWDFSDNDKAQNIINRIFENSYLPQDTLKNVVDIWTMYINQERILSFNKHGQIKKYYDDKDKILIDYKCENIEKIREESGFGKVVNPSENIYVYLKATKYTYTFFDYLVLIMGISFIICISMYLIK